MRLSFQRLVRIGMVGPPLGILNIPKIPRSPKAEARQWLFEYVEHREETIRTPGLRGNRGERADVQQGERMSRLYPYLGSADVRRRVAGQPAGRPLGSPADLLERLGQLEPEGPGNWVCTFVVDPPGYLRLADRHTEHVACSGGEPVLSAGEIWWAVRGGCCEAVALSNQSLGFCPEPQSWPAVAAALERLGAKHPGGFTTEMTFRRCPGCGQINLVKDGWFHCGVCDAPLPAVWNC
jgi:hypothetical protein